MEQAIIPMESLAQLIRLQLENGGRSSLLVTGISMYPILRHRRDTVELVKPERLRRGDLVLYQRDSGQYILHRIITRPKDGTFICCGDNQWIAEQVRTGQVIALVDTYLRDGKRICAHSWGCRLYVWAWVGLFPVRRPLLWLRRRLGRIRHQLCKHIT